MNHETLPAQGPDDVTVGRAMRGRMGPLMRSMLMRASHITAPHSTLVTEHVGDTCIQCEGRPTFRRTLDGMQPTISFHWFVNCKRSNKAAVHRLLNGVADFSVTPNTEAEPARPAERTP